MFNHSKAITCFVFYPVIRHTAICTVILNKGESCYKFKIEMKTYREIRHVVMEFVSNVSK
jgi:hypothetical protein